MPESFGHTSIYNFIHAGWRLKAVRFCGFHLNHRILLLLWLRITRAFCCCMALLIMPRRGTSIQGRLHTKNQKLFLSYKLLMSHADIATNDEGSPWEGKSASSWIIQSGWNILLGKLTKALKISSGVYTSSWYVLPLGFISHKLSQHSFGYFFPCHCIISYVRNLGL